MFKSALLFHVLVCIFVIAAPAAGQGSASRSTEADRLVERAVLRAAAESKTVLVDFFASWCVPCRKFDAFLKTPDISPLVSQHFVLLKLTVWESGSRSTFNTPGAESLLEKFGGDAGLPYTAFLDASGRKIGELRGFGSENTAAQVASILDLIAPRMFPAERATFLRGVREGANARASAEALLEDASTRAKRERKRVLVEFRTRWSAESQRLQAILEDPEISAVLGRYYVTTSITLWNLGGLGGAQLNDPGGPELMRKLGVSGTPGFVILDAGGKPLSTPSKSRNPAGRLLEMLAATPRLLPAEKRLLENRISSVEASPVEHAAPRRTRRAVRQQVEWLVPHRAELFSPSVSADGRVVAATGRGYPEGLRGKLLVHNLVEKTTQIVSLADGSDSVAAVEQPVLSADGQRVAVVAKGANDGDFRLQIYDSLTSNAPRTVLSATGSWLRPASWSEDGRWLAVELGRGGAGDELLVIAASDGAMRMRKSFPRGTFAPQNVLGQAPTAARLSPDGRYLGVDLRTPTDRNIAVLKVADGSVVGEIADPSDSAVIGWSNERLLYSTDRTGSVSVWSTAVAADGLATPTRMSDEVGGIDPFGITRNGQILYVPRSEATRELGVISIDFSTGTLNGTLAPLSHRFSHRSQDAAWSADGAQLVYVSNRAGLGDHTVLVVRGRNGTARETRPQLRRAARPHWSPDGTSVVVEGDGADGEGVYLVDMTSGNTRFLAGDASVRVWSSRLLLERRLGQGGAAILEVDPATGSEREVFKDAGGDPERLAISDDGSRLVYRLAGAQGSFQLRLRDLPTLADQPVFEGRAAGDTDQVFLSPDGQHALLHQTNTEGRPQLVRVNLRSGQAIKVPEVGSGAAPAFLAWAPDGGSILVRKLADGNRQVWWVPLSGSAARHLGDWPTTGRAAVQPHGSTVVLTTPEPGAAPYSEVWSLQLERER